MAESVLCLDISQETVSAVRLERSGKVATVAACVCCPVEGRAPGEIAAEVRAACGFVKGRVLLGLGAEFFSFRNIALPFTGKSQIAQILPFELAEQTPLAMEQLLVDYFIAGSGGGGSEVLAAMLPRRTLADQLAAWRGAGVDIDTVGLAGLATARMIAEAREEAYLLLDCSGSRVTLFVGGGGRVRLIRCLPLPPDTVSQEDFVNKITPAFRQTLLALPDAGAEQATSRIVLAGEHLPVRKLTAVLARLFPEVTPENYRVSGQPLVKFATGVRPNYRPETMDRALALGLGRGGKGPRLEFLQGEMRTSRFSGRQRRIFGTAALVAALCLILVVGYFGKDYAGNLARQEQLNQEIAAVFQQTIPEATRIVNPVQQLQVINNELRSTYRPGGNSAAGATVIQLLSELSARIPENLEVRISRLVADGETVRLRGVTGDFNTVDSVQRELANSSLFKGVTISSASQSLVDDEVRFELKLGLAGQ